MTEVTVVKGASALTNLKDMMARELYGMSRTKAHEDGVCVSCKKYIHTLPHTPAEYWLSGLCDACFNEATKSTEGTL